MVVVERFKQESRYGLSTGTKKVVAVVKRWLSVEVQLFTILIIIVQNISHQEN